jgi:hypothetical protein
MARRYSIIPPSVGSRQASEGIITNPRAALLAPKTTALAIHLCSRIIPSITIGFAFPLFTITIVSSRREKYLYANSIVGCFKKDLSLHKTYLAGCMLILMATHRDRLTRRYCLLFLRTGETVLQQLLGEDNPKPCLPLA